jgi:hypothetical protein
MPSDTGIDELLAKVEVLLRGGRVETIRMRALTHGIVASVIAKEPYSTNLVQREYPDNDSVAEALATLVEAEMK